MIFAAKKQMTYRGNRVEISRLAVGRTTSARQLEWSPGDHLGVLTSSARFGFRRMRIRAVSRFLVEVALRSAHAPSGKITATQPGTSVRILPAGR